MRTDRKVVQLKRKQNGQWPILFALCLLGLQIAVGQPPRDTRARPEARPAIPQRASLPGDGAKSDVGGKSFFGTHCGHPVAYEVDLPSGYEKGLDHYPVIYWLHGIGGNHETFKATGVPRQFYEEALRQGKMPPSILVYVNGEGDSFYSDRVDGTQKVETSIMFDLLPFIATNYRVRQGRENRILMGFSMGGFGAMKLALKYPLEWAAAVSIDGALLEWPEMNRRHGKQVATLFQGKETEFLANSPHSLADVNGAMIKESTLRLRLVVGKLIPQNEAFHKRLTESGIAHEYERTDCGHQTPCILGSEVRKSYNFVGEVLGRKP